jgi:SAM-dependent methyltransferase
VSAAPADDLLATAMVDFAAGQRAPVWFRVAPGRRLAHDLAAYFAPVTGHERALLDLAEGPVLDVGCGPARHARLLQARGLTAIGLDRSRLALGLARSLGLRYWLHADALSGPLPAVRTALLLDGNLGMAGTPAGAVRFLHRLAAACGPGGRLLVGGRTPATGGFDPWSSATSTRTWSGIGGGGCRPVSRPSEAWPPRQAGASSTPPPRALATGPRSPSIRPAPWLRSGRRPAAHRRPSADLRRDRDPAERCQLKVRPA